MPFLKRLNRDHSWFFDLLILSGLYLFLRLWHFPTLFAFNPDQALHLFEAKQMVVNQDWRLVGPMVSSKVYGGRGFFIGPQYYYLLGVLGIITNWSPYLITLILMFLNLGVILLLVRLTEPVQQM